MTLPDEYAGRSWTNTDGGFCEVRKLPGKNAKVGATATLAQCLSGDEVWLYNKAGTRKYKATVAWVNPHTACVRIGDSLASEDMRTVTVTAKIVWRKVRPK